MYKDIKYMFDFDESEGETRKIIRFDILSLGTVYQKTKKRIFLLVG